MSRLATTLADFREEAATLRRNGHTLQADSIERVCDAVRDAAHPYLNWMAEPDAQLRSGFGPDYFRARREAWAEDGLAEKRGRTWYYCELIVPRRKLSSIVRAEARRGAA